MATATTPFDPKSQMKIERVYFSRNAYPQAGVGQGGAVVLDLTVNNADGNFPDVRGKFPQGQTFHAKRAFLQIAGPASNNAGGAVAGAADDVNRIIAGGVLQIYRGSQKALIVEVPLSHCTSPAGGAVFFSSGGSTNNTQIAGVRPGRGYNVSGLKFDNVNETYAQIVFPAGVAVATSVGGYKIEISFSGDWVGPKTQ